MSYNILYRCSMSYYIYIYIYIYVYKIYRWIGVTIKAVKRGM